MKAFRLFLWMTLLTGIFYPLVITGIAALAMPKQAKGSLLELNQKVVGSTLLSQKFESARYFWPRPSAIDYNPLPSGGSNFAPTSGEWKQKVDERRHKLMAAFEVTDSDQIPSELLFASGSGLDPHILRKTAYFQAARVAKARGIDEKRLEKLIEAHVLKRRFGFLGVPCVNVLLLNAALDREVKNE